MTGFVFVWLFCAVVCAIIAGGKGRSGFLWLVLGAIFGIFALVAILSLPRISDDVYVEPKGFLSSTKKIKRIKCPDCAEFIRSDARVCKHCGYRFDSHEHRGALVRERH